MRLLEIWSVRRLPALPAQARAGVRLDEDLAVRLRVLRVRKFGPFGP